jgi:porin
MSRTYSLVRVSVATALILAGGLATAFASDLDGAVTYKSHCASCHDNSAATRAPSMEALQTMSVDRIVQSLESGSMKDQGAGLTADEKRGVAEYLTGKSATAAQTAASDQAKLRFGLSANPRAASGFFGNGMLGRALGIKEGSGVAIGGLLILDGNWLMAGGVKPNSLSGNFLLGLNLSIDTAKAFHIPGGQVGAEFLEFNGSNTNGYAGSVQSYNGLTGSSPLTRQELHQLWWRQKLFRDKLILKLGKLNGTSEFNTVLMPVPVPVPVPKMVDWTVSDLIYAPSGINPTLFSRLPGYYNTAYGATIAFLPTKSFYASYGIFDGNLGRYVQTGLKLAPDFNSYKFNIGEAGYAWRAGSQGKPGRIAAGGWHQTGSLPTPAGTNVNGTSGFYAFASQRLWYHHPGEDSSGLESFYQFGYANSGSALVTRYAGAGLTGIGLVRGRPWDTIGLGLAWSRLNQTPGAGAFFFPGVPSASTSLRPSEVMWQGYYQAVLIPWKLVLVGAYTSTPTPGERPDLPWAHALTVRLNVLF